MSSCFRALVSVSIVENHFSPLGLKLQKHPEDEIALKEFVCLFFNDHRFFFLSQAITIIGWDVFSPSSRCQSR